MTIACAAAVVAAVLANHPGSEDFTQVWMAAQVLLKGGDPYALIGPGRQFPSTFPLYYPGSAAVVLLPFTILPASVGRVIFAAAGAALFTLAITRDGFARLPWLASYAFLSCLFVVQWTTWLAAATMFPALGFLASAKPNAGAVALAAMRPGRPLLAALGGSAVVCLVALALDPDWSVRWLQTVEGAPHIRALVVTYPAAILMLAGLLRWRRPEARALALLALVPHNPLPHNFLLLAVGRWTLAESLVLAALSWCVMAVVWPGGRQAADFTALGTASARAAVLLLYLPALAMLLRKPNEGSTPAWLESLAGRWRRS